MAVDRSPHHQVSAHEARPNILWIMTDEQRTDSLGCYGVPWARTPTIDALAAQGVVFQYAYAQCPQCVPSRNSQLTARYPQETCCTFNQGGIDFPDGMPTLVDVLNDAGYHTTTFGKQHTSMPLAWQEQFDGILDKHYAGYYQLADRYDPADYHVINRPSDDQPIIISGVYPGGDDHPSAQITDRAVAYLNDHGDDQPFFLRVSHNYPHTPVLPSPPWESLYDNIDIPLAVPDDGTRHGRSRWDQLGAAPQGMDKLTAEQVRRCWRHYMGLCAQVDHEIGRLLTALDAQGLRDHTIILFSSDHGTCLGQFGVATKGTFDDPSWHVPFIWSWPGHVPVGGVDSDPCELLDTGRTLLNLCGLGDCVPASWRGRDLFNEPPAEAVFSQIGYPTMRSVVGRAAVDQREHFRLLRMAMRDTRWRMDYSFMRDGQRLEPTDGNLFDVQTDPGELDNLWDDPSYRTVRQACIDRIIAWFDGMDKPDAMFASQS